jgi:hypothetical protein
MPVGENICEESAAMDDAKADVRRAVVVGGERGDVVERLDVVVGVKAEREEGEDDMAKGEAAGDEDGRNADEENEDEEHMEGEKIGEEETEAAGVRKPTPTGDGE